MAASRKRLHNTDSRGKRRDWTGAKLKAIATAAAYQAADADTHGKRAERIANCANQLRFTVANDQMTLRNAYACKVRTCPVCMALNARRAFAILAARVAEHGRRHPRALPVLLTLTVRNVEAAQLGTTVTLLTTAFRRLVRYRRVSRAVLGWHRSLEITFNPIRRDFHPHIHALMWMRDGYFAANSPLYLTQPDWVQLWAAATGHPPGIVHIKRLGRDTAGLLDPKLDGLFEAVKYVVKPAGFYEQTAHGWRVAPEVLAALHHAIAGRRLRDTGGSLRQIKAPKPPRRVSDDELAAAHVAIETYVFGETVDTWGEIFGPDYWQRAPPDEPAADVPVPPVST